MFIHRLKREVQIKQPFEGGLKLLTGSVHFNA